LRGDIAGRIGRREIAGTADQLRGSFEPVLRKSGLKTDGAGPLDPDLNVAPLRRIFGVADPLIGDPRASGECDAAIDDERLPVVTMVEMSDRSHPDPVVPGDFASA